jgi:uncharacterized membrane protein
MSFIMTTLLLRWCDAVRQDMWVTYIVVVYPHWLARVSPWP